MAARNYRRSCYPANCKLVFNTHHTPIITHLPPPTTHQPVFEGPRPLEIVYHSLSTFYKPPSPFTDHLPPHHSPSDYYKPPSPFTTSSIQLPPFTIHRPCACVDIAQFTTHHLLLSFTPLLLRATAPMAMPLLV